MSPYQRALNLYLDGLLAVHSFGVSLDRRKRAETLSAVDRYSIDAAAQLDGAAIAERDRWLRERLRRFPFWIGGHIALASVSLRRNDIGSAYASAVAALKLSPRGASADRARIALGRAYLRRGDSHRAIETFEAVVRGGGADCAVTEDLAAAYLSEGNFFRTIELLESIPEALRSGEGVAALSYARRRRDGGV